jgi:hypothetical protein
VVGDGLGAEAEPFGSSQSHHTIAEHPPAALPDEVWPDQSPFPASDTAVS